MRKDVFSIFLLGILLITACSPRVQWTDKLTVKERKMLLDKHLVPEPELLSDTLVFHVEHHDIPNGKAIIIQVKPLKNLPCGAPLCGRIVWHDTVVPSVKASPWLPLQNSGDLKFLTGDDKAVYTEYFDAGEDQLRYYAYRFSDGNIYQTGWISGLYLFRPEKTDWNQGTYTLFSMQEKLELSKRWRPLTARH